MTSPRLASFERKGGSVGGGNGSRGREPSGRSTIDGSKSRRLGLRHGYWGVESGLWNLVCAIAITHQLGALPQSPRRHEQPMMLEPIADVTDDYLSDWTDA